MTLDVELSSDVSRYGDSRKSRERVYCALQFISLERGIGIGQKKISEYLINTVCAYASLSFNVAH